MINNKIKKILAFSLMVTSIGTFSATTAFANVVNPSYQIATRASIPSGYEYIRDLAADADISITWIESSKSIKFSGGAMGSPVTLKLSYIQSYYGAVVENGRTYMSRESFSDMMFFEFNIQ